MIQFCKDGTWFAFSWDVMEPFCYFLNSTVVIWGAVYYCIAKRENSYESLFGRMKTKILERDFQKNGFDFEKQKELLAEKHSIERHLCKF